MAKKKIAIILFNLGGPDSLSAVKPFLFNLFYDPAIIRLTKTLRWLVAKIISTSRNKKAQEIYELMGGKSPILPQTIAQKEALNNILKEQLNEELEIFICMRYWHPMSREVARQVERYNPTEVILLPLYPQFSTTTTGSSVKEFIKHFSSKDIPIKTVCCYHREENFINSHLNLLKESLSKAKDSNYRILFSAHGLPVSIIKAGDPYQWQIEQTVKEIVTKLAIKELDYKITYQSRVGPVEWLKPNTEDEIRLAGEEQKNLVIVPIAFVSEHSETLVELDIEYKAIADKFDIEYIRVPTLQINENFIASLAKMVIDFVGAGSKNICSSNNFTKICPKEFSGCIGSIKT